MKLMHGRAVARVEPCAARHHLSRRLGEDDLGAVDCRKPQQAGQVASQAQYREERRSHARAREAGEPTHLTSSSPCIDVLARQRQSRDSLAYLQSVAWPMHSRPRPPALQRNLTLLTA